MPSGECPSEAVTVVNCTHMSITHHCAKHRRVAAVGLLRLGNYWLARATVGLRPWESYCATFPHVICRLFASTTPLTM